MLELGYCQFRIVKNGIAWGEPMRAPYDEECIAIKRWIKRNFAAFAAYVRALPNHEVPKP